MLFGRGTYSLCQWFLIIILAKLGTAEKLGQFTYALALTSPVVIFSQLNLRAFMATDSKRQFELKYITSELVSLPVLYGKAHESVHNGSDLPG